MLSEFGIGQAGHFSDCLLLLGCSIAHLLIRFIQSFTFLKLFFKGSLFSCQLIFAGKIFFGGDLRFSVLFVQGKLFSSASVILSLEQYKLTLQALVSDSCSFFDFRGFNACDLDLSF